MRTGLAALIFRECVDAAAEEAARIGLPESEPLANGAYRVRNFKLKACTEFVDGGAVKSRYPRIAPQFS